MKMKILGIFEVKSKIQLFHRLQPISKTKDTLTRKNVFLQ